MDQAASAREIAERHTQRIGGPITALREIAAAFGYVQRAHMEAVAETFNLSVAEVRGIVGFYGDLNTEPRGRAHIRICQAEACQSVGARELTAAAVARFGAALGATSPDGSVSLEAVYCLGLCTTGPAAMVNDRVVVRATPEALAP